jgi:hypothetical protein
MALRPRTRAAVALTIPTDDVDWYSNNGWAQTRDTALAASLERAFPLRAWGPGRVELRAAAGVAVHHRVTSGSTSIPYASVSEEDVRSFAAGPTLTGTAAYVLHDRCALLASATGGATFPDRDFVVNGYSLSSPGHFNWSFGLLAEVALWMQRSR